MPDGTPEPPDDPTQVIPSTWPGSRAPHVWMADGRSSLDLFGREFTLVRTDPRAEVGGSLTVAAAAAGLPLREVLVEDAAVAAAFERRTCWYVRTVTSRGEATRSRSVKWMRPRSSTGCEAPRNNSLRPTRRIKSESG